MRRLPVLCVATVSATTLLVGCSSSSSPAGPDRSSRTEIVTTTSTPSSTATAATAATAAMVPVPATCPSAIRRLIVREAGRDVSVARQRSDGLLQCTFSARRPARTACSKAVTIINTQPQAYKAFDRWAVEAGQNAMWTHTPSLNPTPVGGIGILAEWVPGSHTFETSTATTWVAIFLTCPAHNTSGLTLAKAAARAALSATAAASH